MSRTSQFQHLQLSNRAGVAHVVLNRPNKLNTLGLGPGSSRAEIVDALQWADRDPDVGVILLRANGPSFCAGGDLGTAAATTERSALEELHFVEETSGFLAAVRSIHKPIICAVHGLCLGAALGLIVQCDIVIAGDDACFGLIEGRIGHPGASELVSVIGTAWAKYLILSGELIDALQAQAIGLVLTVEPSAELQTRASDLAERMARLPREALALNKACINQVAEASGRAAGRVAGRAHDSLTKAMSSHAAAPDGRRFVDILRDEGVPGMKQARDTQFQGNWLKRSRP